MTVRMKNELKDRLFSLVPLLFDLVLSQHPSDA